jgi:membrane complex biogenesis BtpA family protein
MTTWLDDLFGVRKPIIAMCHLQALPGDPHYDAASGMKGVVAAARADLRALQDGGVDGIMFSNEFSLPYLTTVPTVTTASMARVIAELYSDIRVPFGVNVLWDPKASLDLAAATGAKFVREIFTGVYASDFGLWNTNHGEVARHQRHIHTQDVRLLFNILPEAASYLGNRDIVSIARSTVFNTGADAICISGLTAGVETSAAALAQVKDALPDTPVFANTGVNLGNVQEQLSIADGAVVATTFKVDGIFKNAVDESRVAAFMARVNALFR